MHKVCHRPTPPSLIPHGAAERWQLQGQLQHEANRLALAVWWAGYPEAEAQRELSGYIADAVIRGRYSISGMPLAKVMLSKALAVLEGQYADTHETVKVAVLNSLQSGQPYEMAVLRAA